MRPQGGLIGPRGYNPSHMPGTPTSGPRYPGAEGKMTKLFKEYQDARDYAESLDAPFALSYDTVAGQWAVEPMTEIPGG